MLSLHNVSRSFNLDPILSEITFHINAGDRVGLIGPNGCGKTTLLRIAAGLDRPDSGSVVLSPPDAVVGFLAQGFTHDEESSIAALIDGATGGLDQVAERLATLGAALAQTPAARLARTRVASGAQQAAGSPLRCGDRCPGFA